MSEPPRLSADLRLLLQCPVCGQLPSGPIVSCVNGHHVCRRCRDAVRAANPLCAACAKREKNPAFKPCAWCRESGSSCPLCRAYGMDVPCPILEQLRDRVGQTEQAPDPEPAAGNALGLPIRFPPIPSRRPAAAPTNAPQYIPLPIPHSSSVPVPTKASNSVQVANTKPPNSVPTTKPSNSVPVPTTKTSNSVQVAKNKPSNSVPVPTNKFSISVAASKLKPSNPAPIPAPVPTTAPQAGAVAWGAAPSQPAGVRRSQRIANKRSRLLSAASSPK